MAKQADLLSVEEARARILDQFQRLDVEDVPLGQAHRRVLGGAAVSSMDLPPFANSSMDGFALQSESTQGARPELPVSLRVGQTIPAGAFSSVTVRSGECARIMTGAPLPPGVNAVVPFEDVDDRGDEIWISSPITPHACVRPAGQDLRAGIEVIPAGTELDSRHVGLLAALGLGTVKCVRQPVVSLLSTGNELVAPGNPLQPGQIYNSNTPMLAAALVEAGAIPRVLPTAGDDHQQIAAAIQSAQGSDFLLTSGGASVGDFDYMKDVLGQSGQLNFWRVRIRPGKPLLFGSFGALRFIGLPGNPTSGMVTFEEFVRPAIRLMLGAPLFRPSVMVRLDDRIDNRGGRRTYARARLRFYQGEFHATLSGPQDSAMLTPLANADGVVIVPEDRDELRAEEMATMQVWRLPSD